MEVKSNMLCCSKCGPEYLWHKCNGYRTTMENCTECGHISSWHKCDGYTTDVSDCWKDEIGRVHMGTLMNFGSKEVKRMKSKICEECKKEVSIHGNFLRWENKFHHIKCWLEMMDG